MTASGAVPALVLAGEHQIDEQQRQAKTKYIWLPTSFSWYDIAVHS